jgi:hypothetical protein
MQAHLNLYAPSATSPWVIDQPPSISIDRQANFPAQLTATFTADYDRYKDDNDANNPVQRGAFEQYMEGSRCEHQGKIKRWSSTLVNGRWAITVTALDKLQVLNETFATYNGDYVWSRQTPAIALSEERLWPAYDYGDGLRNVWYPDPASAQWLSTAVLNSTHIRTAMASGVSPASGSRQQMDIVHGGLPPAGFISIGTEWIEYNGYALDPADGYWYIHQIRRGALGTTAAAHADDSVAYSRLSKRLDPRGRVKIEGTDSTAYTNPVLIPLRNHCQPQWEGGGFAFSGPPLSMAAGSAFVAVYAKRSYFDEEGGSVLMLSEVLRNVLTADPAIGAPGLGGAWTDTCTVDVSGLSPDVRLTRVSVKKKTKVLPFITGLLEEINLQRGPAGDAVMIYYDSVNDKVVVTTVSQALGTVADPVDFSYYDEASRIEERNSELLHSAMLVEYDSPVGFNLVQPIQMWHTPSTNTGRVDPEPYVYQRRAGTWYAQDMTGTGIFHYGRYNATQDTTSGSATSCNLLTDNDNGTGFGLVATTLPSPATVLIAWFPGANNTTPDQFFVTRLVASFYMVGSGAGYSGGPTLDIDYEFVGYQTLTGSLSNTPPTTGTEVPLSNQACIQYTAGAVNSDGLTLDIPVGLVPCRGIGLKINGYLKDDVSPGSNKYGFFMLDLAVYGVQKQYELVTLKGTYNSSDTNTLVSAGAALKQLDVHMGQFDCGEVYIGTATKEVARNFGWVTLLQALAASQAVGWLVSSYALDREGIAGLGSTVGFSDGFIGVLDASTYTVANGRRELNLRAVNYRETIAGVLSCSQLPPPRHPALRRSTEIRKAATGRTQYISLEG